MKALPISEEAKVAARGGGPLAPTQAEAERLAGGVVSLAVEEAPGCFATVEAAEAAFPSLYSDPRFALVWREGGYRVAVRFWRPSPAAPVARGVRAAARAPLGAVRDRGEAERLLGAAAELVEEPVALYVSRARAEAARHRLAAPAAARVVAVGERFQLLQRYWRPQPPTPDLAVRAAAPLRGRGPQATPYVGLFEQLAPENPAVILAEEGDGRWGDS